MPLRPEQQLAMPGFAPANWPSQDDRWGGFRAKSLGVFGVDGGAAPAERDAVAVALPGGFGLAAESAEPLEAEADGAVAVGAQSWVAVCVATGAGAAFARAGANAGAANSKPRVPGCCGASAVASPARWK